MLGWDQSPDLSRKPTRAVGSKNWGISLNTRYFLPKICYLFHKPCIWIVVWKEQMPKKEQIRKKLHYKLQCFSTLNITQKTGAWTLKKHIHTASQHRGTPHQVNPANLPPGTTVPSPTVSQWSFFSCMKNDWCDEAPLMNSQYMKL